MLGKTCASRLREASKGVREYVCVHSSKHNVVAMCKLKCVCEHNMYVSERILYMNVWVYVYVCLRGNAHQCQHLYLCVQYVCVCLYVFFEVSISEFTICNAQLILPACIYRGTEHLLKWPCRSLLLHPLQRHRHCPGRPSAERS